MGKKITILWNPRDCDIIPTVEGQSRVLPDGTIEAWYFLDKDADALFMAEKLKQALAEPEEILPAPE